MIYFSLGWVLDILLLLEESKLKDTKTAGYYSEKPRKASKHNVGKF